MYLGMIVFCHKVAKRRFVWGVSFLCAAYFGLWLYFSAHFGAEGKRRRPCTYLEGKKARWLSACWAACFGAR